MTEQGRERPRLRVVESTGDLAREQDEAAKEAVRVIAGAEFDRLDHEVLLALALGDDVLDERVMQSERRDADELRNALETGLAHPLIELGESLRAAGQMREIARADDAALLSIVLGEVALEGDDLAAQRLGAEEFARALAGGGNPVAELAVALRCAHQPRAIDELALERALRRGFGRGRERTMVPIVAAMVAVAAAVALWFVSTSPVHEGSGRAAEAAARAALIAPHSTDALFEPSTPFPATGGESERLEKIVSARATDLRANRFARWGVR